MQKQLFSKTAARAPRAAQWVAVDRSEMPVTVPALDGTFDSHIVGRKAGSMLQLQIATNLWAPFKRHKNESDPAMQLRIRTSGRDALLCVHLCARFCMCRAVGVQHEMHTFSLLALRGRILEDAVGLRGHLGPLHPLVRRGFDPLAVHDHVI